MIKNILKLCSDNSDLKCQNSNINVIWNKTKSKKMGLWSLQSKILRSYALITLTCSVKMFDSKLLPYCIDTQLPILSTLHCTGQIQSLWCLNIRLCKSFKGLLLNLFAFSEYLPIFFLLEQAKYHSQRAGQREWLFFLQTKGVVLRSQITLHSV